MSGVKYSRIQLEKEKKARQEALGRISALTNSIEGLKENIRTILNQIPEGVKEAFPAEIQRVKDWVIRNVPTPSDEMNSTQLNKVVEKLQRMVDEGREALCLLIEVKEEKRDKKARELIGSLERLRADLTGMKPLLNKWRPKEYESLAEILNGLSQVVEKGEFVKAEGDLSRSKEILERLNQEATSLEAQDNQRRYVLEALRDVCKQMGWAETKKPELKESDNPTSPLLYEVNTYYAGKIAFSLTLEGIRVNSEIPTENNACYKEFDNLSERLKKFGVMTKFERETSDEEPKLLRKGELDLPDEGREMEMEL